MLPVSLPQVLQAAQQAAAEEMHTATIGRVLTYYPVDMTADIEVCVAKPLVNPNDGVVYEPLGTLPKVPVQFPRSKKYSIVWELEANDTVLLVFCETSIAEWRMGAKVGEPADTRRHSIGYPIAIPGLFPDLQPAANATVTPGAMVLGSELSPTSKVEITASGIFLGHNASQFIALAPPTQAQLDELRTKLATLTTLYKAHTHPIAVTGVTPGSGAGAGTSNVPTNQGSATAPTNTGPVTSVLTKSL